MKPARVIKPRSKKHYVNNKTLYEEMIKYRDSVALAEVEGKDKPRIPRYIGECMLMICKKLSTKPNFMNYSYREDMVADGIENCIGSIHNFDPSKSTNPFAYFTQIAWNAFIRRITSEKKQAYIKHKNYQNSFLMSDFEEGVSLNTNEFSDDVIQAFENKLQATKDEKKSKMEAKKLLEIEDAK
jgi:hypothetical protein